MDFNLSNLKLARAVFDRLDPATVNLDQWYQECGTIACGFGHLSWSDEFQAFGLKPKKSTVNDQMMYPCIGNLSISESAQFLFGGGKDEAFWLLFVEKGESDYDSQIPWQSMDDLAVLRYRVDTLIKDVEKGQM